MASSTRLMIWQPSNTSERILVNYIQASQRTGSEDRNIKFLRDSGRPAKTFEKPLSKWDMGKIKHGGCLVRFLLEVVMVASGLIGT